MADKSCVIFSGGYDSFFRSLSDTFDRIKDSARTIRDSKKVILDFQKQTRKLADHHREASQALLAIPNRSVENHVNSTVMQDDFETRLGAVRNTLSRAVLNSQLVEETVSSVDGWVQKLDSALGALGENLSFLGESLSPFFKFGQRAQSLTWIPGGLESNAKATSLSVKPNTEKQQYYYRLFEQLVKDNTDLNSSLYDYIKIFANSDILSTVKRGDVSSKTLLRILGENESTRAMSFNEFLDDNLFKKNFGIKTLHRILEAPRSYSLAKLRTVIENYKSTIS